MCGIFALINPSGKPADLPACRNAVNLLKHRGPDAYGEWISDGGDVFLGHRRLSIIDLSDRSNQPMVGPSGKVLIFNGEIFNFEEVRKQLENMGQAFKTSGDTEVLLKALETWGIDCLCRLEGMFAFLLWDPLTREALAARDFFGIKPFYLARTGAGGLAVSSEIKSFYALPEFRPELNRDALPEYLRFRCITGEETLLREVIEVVPGHAVRYDQARGTLRKDLYWSPVRALEDIGASTSRAESRSRFKAVFRDTLERHLIADVPVGVQFSGGIDSGLVAAVGLKDLGAHLVGFHCRIEEPGFDEGPYALAMARSLGMELFTVSLDRATFFSDLFDRLTWFHDEPLFHPNSVGIHLVSHLAKGKAKVLLSGEAADECLGGYSRYPLVLIRKLLEARPWLSSISGLIPASRFKEESKARKLIEAIRGADEKGIREHIVEGLGYMRPHTLTALMGNAKTLDLAAAGRQEVYDSIDAPSILARCQLFDIQTYLPPLFMRQDKMSMAASIENRVPFATPAVFGHAFRLHDSDRASPLKRKAFLRSLLGRYVPKRLLARGKAGFGIPIHSWFLMPEGAERLRSMAGNNSQLSGLVSGTEVKRLLSEFNGTMPRANELWTLFALDVWADIFLSREAVLGHAGRSG